MSHLPYVSACPWCGQLTNPDLVGPSSVPAPGAPYVCPACGGIAVVAVDGALRATSFEEERAYRRQPAVIAAQAAVRERARRAHAIGEGEGA